MAYRVAKTALNQQTVTFARDFRNEKRNVTIICMEPGFVPTRLTEFDAVDDMATCIAGIVKVIEGLSSEDTGSFIEWSGKRLKF